jgi:hypothetical protein
MIIGLFLYMYVCMHIEESCIGAFLIKVRQYEQEEI